MTGQHIVTIGAHLRTNYGTCPYVVREIDGPCTCVEYHDQINGRERPSQEHYHLVVRRPCGKGGDYYLNGFTLDGRSVWGKDRLFEVNQMELFALHPRCKGSRAMRRLSASPAVPSVTSPGV